MYLVVDFSDLGLKVKASIADVKVKNLYQFTVSAFLKKCCDNITVITNSTEIDISKYKLTTKKSELHQDKMLSDYCIDDWDVIYIKRR